ncbi:3'-5' exonuclease domain-containing protein 2 [Reichenbachiella carrageenanivorans]|uniref:3'-5' exonuclease n=1 Tax=Reichenbachiella carrageenanivorans TaxID=2979869 RepID=A0ABY6D376_9BACT|nr:3'-5' exonuclease [Reichenbachiella carrageenanivorans]UXX79513.1 3'-5' exonuclease domain-containing protein 2 [Reichenbachiella carrageenanivorans]
MKIRKITKQEVNELPLMKYEGKYQIIDDESQVQQAVAACKKATILGFDTETKPAFRKGESYPVALLQLSLPDQAFLFRLNKISLSKEIVSLFEDPKIKIVGIGIRDDIKDLQKLRDFKPQGFVDLNELGAKLGFESIGARNYAGMFMNHRISKSQQVSNWENEELTDSQISYAATDAWICLEIYRKMMEIKANM